MLHEQIKPADIVATVEANPVSVLTDETLYSTFYNHVKAEVEAFEPNLATASSRKEIASLAYKVKRTKTAIDDAGKKLNEDARAKINAVDAQRRKVREDFDALAELARKPLTDWEKQEEARVEYCKSFIRAIEDCGNGLIGGESYPFPILLRELEEKIVITSDLGEFEEQARVAHRIALDKVKTAFEAHMKAEADRIELEKLRAEKEERDRLEAERLEAERLAKEAAERERAEKERVEREAAEQKAREERAAQLAREKAEREAREAVERAEREKREAIAKAEAEARAVREAAEREQREREAEAKRLADEQAAREADKAHRSSVMKAAKEAIMTCGADEETARKIVLTIVAGEIPHVTLRF